MEEFRQIQKITGDKIFLDIPKSLQDRDVEIIILPYYSKTENKRYNFNRFAGKLQWNGNAVKAQRAIRNEWK
jgi:hypothetical protein